MASSNTTSIGPTSSRTTGTTYVQVSGLLGAVRDFNLTTRKGTRRVNPVIYSFLYPPISILPPRTPIPQAKRRQIKTDDAATALQIDVQKTLAEAAALQRQYGR